ncbi:hypothetical protein N0V90_003793 [Kalmusia sp. IMI 367209]|nr:hypothetical protein N0V90_003793 [Kalmusia sp. IMI 367209]
MTGVCDEVKPICGPCQKGKRICKDPISKVKFARPKGLVTAVSGEGDRSDESQGEMEPLSQISILRSVPTRDGGSFQTMRIGRRRKAIEGPARVQSDDRIPLLRRPTLSPVESLQLILVQSFNIIQPGLRLSLLTEFMTDVPPMLGRSAAFDDAIACLVSFHGQILHGRKSGDDLKQVNLYAKAILSLRAALTDPVESYSDLTLGAVVVAAIRNEECFFNRPEWKQVSFTDVLDCETDFLTDQLERELAALPALLVKIRAFYNSPSEIASNIIYQEALQLRSSLGNISNFVDETLENRLDIIEVPSATGDTLVPTVFQFSTRPLASLCANFWGISVLVDTITARFLPAHTPKMTMHGLQERCLLARQRIFMSYEFTEPFRPLGAMYMSGPLIMAYRGAIAEEKDWIMQRLWQIGELFDDPQAVWGQTNLDYASAYLLGEPIVLPPHYKGCDPHDWGAYGYMQMQFEELSLDQSDVS